MYCGCCISGRKCLLLHLGTVFHGFDMVVGKPASPDLVVGKSWNGATAFSPEPMRCCRPFGWRVSAWGAVLRAARGSMEANIMARADILSRQSRPGP